MAPKTCQPMTFAGLPPVVIGYMRNEVARVECRPDLPQRMFLAGSCKPFEKDDGTTAMRDLRELKLAEMVPKGCKRRAHCKIPTVAHDCWC